MEWLIGYIAFGVIVIGWFLWMAKDAPIREDEEEEPWNVK